MKVKDVEELLSSIENKELTISIYCKSEGDSIEIESIEEEVDCVLIMEGS